MLSASLTHEKAIIGLIARESSYLPQIRSILSPECFSSPALRLFYQAYLEMEDDNKPIDIALVEAHMSRDNFIKAGGVDVLADCMGYVPYDDRAEEYANEVLKQWKQRKFEQLLNLTKEYNESKGFEKARELLEEQLSAMLLQGGGSKLRSISEATSEWLEDFGKGLSDPEHAKTRFLPTGVREYDEKFGGLRKGLNVLMARPGMGKSALALQEILFNARQGRKVIVVSLEMPDVENVNRLVAAISGVDSLRLEKFELGDEDGELSSVYAACEEIERLPIWFTSANDVSSIKSQINQWRRENGCDPSLVVIDYLQLMDSDGDNENLELQKITHNLMRYFKFDVSCPCRLLCQLNRSVEGRADKRPMASDIRSCGAIEQVADVVDALYRDDYYKSDGEEPDGITEIIRRKGRQSPTGSVEVIFVPETLSFESKPKPKPVMVGAY